MLSPHDILLIERYYKGLLSQEEQLRWQERLEQDANFAQELEQYQKLFQGFQALELETFEANVKTWEAAAQAKEVQAPQVSPQPMRLRRSWRSWVAAAAAILLLPVSALLIYQMQGASPTAASLFAESFQEHTCILGSSRGSITHALGETALEEEEELALEEAAPQSTTPLSLKSILNEAVFAYNDANFAQAIEYFQAYIDAQPKGNLHEAEFYMAVSLLAEGKAAEAQNLFSDLRRKKSSGFMAEASDWYLALSYLKMEQHTKAKKVLRKIIKQKRGHQYKTNAQKMLDKMQEYGIE